MYKLVVFDLDGTLANTLSDLASAVNKALISENLPTHRVEAYNHFVGNGIDNLIKQVVGKNCDEQTCKRVKAFFDAYYLEHLCDHTTAYDGMAKLLEQLDTLKVITAVHSNKPHTFVPEILQTLYPQHKFAIAWGKQNHYERKPSAQALNAMMQKLGVEKDQTLYVGDSDVGRKVNFGCGTVTVNYDGIVKSRCTIGDNCFIGCNTNLVAPVKLGKAVYTAAGTTITKDVPDYALAIDRGVLKINEGYSLRKLKSKLDK